ncbi:hypothetical protein CCMSSC00406_0001353 [Pleurotus cornucopiae]|uniref:Uncharacterized protein n=1 Tax=Pleurotus cornucopiae TaxID=5321 RepID=A0ACB7ILY5_PLECO|nr:hypothetical protein CCMSSC00406_0001353 [Pleurotus cornucopiae]
MQRATEQEEGPYRDSLATDTTKADSPQSHLGDIGLQHKGETSCIMASTDQDTTHQFSLDYTLPPLVGSLQQSWTTTFQSGAVVVRRNSDIMANTKLTGRLSRRDKSALLAANAINLLILFKDKDNFSDIPAGVCPPSLLILAYISVVTNSCATVTAMVVTDMISDLCYKSSCQRCRLKRSAVERGTTTEHMMQILQGFGAPKGIYSWRFFLIYWLVLFVSGFVITVAEILLFIATVEVKWVEITLFVVIIIVCLPPFLYFLPGRSRLEH